MKKQGLKYDVPSTTFFHINEAKSILAENLDSNTLFILDHEEREDTRNFTSLFFQHEI